MEIVFLVHKHLIPHCESREIPWVAEARLRDISSVMLGFVVGYCDVWEVV